MTLIAETIYQTLTSGENVILATIFSHHGSTPRTAGAKMVIFENHHIEGTIGGGLLEAQVLKAAQKVFKNQGSQILSFDLNAPATVDSMDMICGGDVEVLLEFIQANQLNTDFFSQFAHSIKHGTIQFMITTLPQRDNPAEIQRCIMNVDGSICGPLKISKGLIDRLRSQTNANCDLFVSIDDDQRFLIEALSRKPTVYLYGAGHVSQEVARLTQRVDFRTVILDDRKEFANRQRFEAADNIILLQNFAQALAGVEIDADSYVVIVTRGHQHDKLVLEQALKTEAGYIGMIGSRRKRNAIYQALAKQGFTRKDLDRVHSPIGIEIEAETPQEIAVSIVAELIAVRARKKCWSQFKSAR